MSVETIHGSQSKIIATIRLQLLMRIVTNTTINIVTHVVSGRCCFVEISKTGNQRAVINNYPAKFYLSSITNVSSLTKNSTTSSSTFFESESSSSVSISENIHDDFNPKLCLCRTVNIISNAII